MKNLKKPVYGKETEWSNIFSTGEFHSLAVDDEVGQLLGNLSTLLLVLRKIKLLTQLHVKDLRVQVDTGHDNITWRDSDVLIGAG